MNNRLLKKYKKTQWKPGTIEYPLPAVMVSVGNMDNSNIITIAWTRCYLLRSSYGICFCKTIEIFL